MICKARGGFALEALGLIRGWQKKRYGDCFGGEMPRFIVTNTVGAGRVSAVVLFLH